MKRVFDFNCIFNYGPQTVCFGLFNERANTQQWTWNLTNSKREKHMWRVFYTPECPCKDGYISVRGFLCLSSAGYFFRRLSLALVTRNS